MRHLSANNKNQLINDNRRLTDLSPRLSLLWIEMASSSCKISDSIVVTRSSTSGVLTKRTNLQGINMWITRLEMPMPQVIVITKGTNLSTVPLVNHGAPTPELGSSVIEYPPFAIWSWATFRCARNGFSRPEAIFSFRPFTITTKSNLQKVKNDDFHQTSWDGDVLDKH